MIKELFLCVSSLFAETEETVEGLMGESIKAYLKENPDVLATEVASTLKDNPDLLRKPVDDFFTKNPDYILNLTRDSSNAKISENASKIQSDLLDNNYVVSLGNKDAPGKMLIFSDPNCPYSRAVLETVFSELDKNPDIDVEFLIRDWPVLQNSVQISKILLASEMASKERCKPSGRAYKILMQRLAQEKPPTNLRRMEQIIETSKKELGFGLNVLKAIASDKGETIKTILRKNSALAKESLNLEGVPVVFIIDADKNMTHLPLSDTKDVVNAIRKLAALNNQGAGYTKNHVADAEEEIEEAEEILDDAEEELEEDEEE